MFKIARNHPKTFHLCQKPAKSGSTRICKCVLTSPSGGHLCNLGHNGFQNSGKLFINWKPSRGRCSTIFDATEYSTVKLHVLGNVICLTILFNHLWIEWLKWSIIIKILFQIYLLILLFINNPFHKRKVLPILYKIITPNEFYGWNLGVCKKG